MNRNYRYPSEPRWLLETMPSDGTPWRVFIVIVVDKGDRWNYRLAHDGNRFARSGALRLLCDDFPDVAVEVCEWIEMDLRVAA